MANCDRCKEQLRDYKWALIPGKRKIEQICQTCLIKEKFPEMKVSKYLNGTKKVENK